MRTVARHATPVVVPTGLPDDWFDRLAEHLDDLVEAGGVRLSNAEFGVVALDEIVLHGWDLAVALGVSFSVADEDVEAIHGFVAAMEHATEQERAGLFGAVVDDPAAAGLDRILALSGRDARTSDAVAA